MKYCIVLSLLFIFQMKGLALNRANGELLRQTVTSIINNGNDVKDISVIQEASDSFGIPVLGEYSAIIKEHLIDIQNKCAREATLALTLFAEKQYGVETVEAIYSRRAEILANAYFDEDYTISLARRNLLYAQQLTAKDISVTALKLLTELELMVLEGMGEGENPLRWEKLFQLEQQVIPYMEKEKRDTQEKMDICSYMADLKNNTSSFSFYIRYLFNKYFPDGMDIPNRMLDENVSNAEYYYQQSLEIHERLHGANAVSTLTAKQNYLDFLVQRDLTTFEDAYPQLKDIKSKLLTHYSSDDPLVLSAELSLWKCLSHFGQDVSELSGYRAYLTKVANFYSMENQVYLNSLYQVMNLMLSYNTMLAERLQGEMLQLAEQLYKDEPDIYGQYLYGGISVTFSSDNQEALCNFIQRLAEFYQKTHHSSWSSVALGNGIAELYGKYMLRSDQERKFCKMALDDLGILSGENSLLYATNLYEYCRILCLSPENDSYETAIALCHKVIETYKEYKIPTAIPYTTLSDAYLALGQTDNYEQALRSGLASHKDRDLWRCYLLTKLAQKLLSDNKDTKEADNLLEEAVPIFKEMEDEIWGEFFAIYTFLGDCYWFKNQPKYAEETLLRGKERHEELYGQYDSNYKNIIDNLITLYAYALNDMDKADQVVRQCLDGIKDNPAFALHDITLSLLLDYLRLVNQKLPDDHLRLGLLWKDILNEVNVIRSNVKENSKQVLPIIKAVLYEMPNHFFKMIADADSTLSKLSSSEINKNDIQQSLNNLVHFRSACKQDILPLYLEMEEEIRTSNTNYLENFEYYEACSCLYSYFLYMDPDEAKAESYLLPLTKSKNKIIQSNAHSGLASLYFQRGDYEKAVQLLEEEKKHISPFLSIANRATLYATLASSYYALKQYDKALEPAINCHMQRKQLAQQNFDLLTQEEREAFIKEGGIGGGWIYTLLPHFPDKLNTMSYDCILEEKGMLLRASDRIKMAILQSGNQELISQIDSLNRLTTSLKTRNTILTDISHDNEVVKIRQKIETLERSINRQAAQFTAGMKTPDWKQLQGVLKPGEAAIEYVFSDSILGMMVLLPQGNPQYVMMTNSNELWKELDQLNSLSAKVKAERLYESDLLHLYEKLWQPAEQLLGDVKTVYFSPTGFLNDLAFAAFKCVNGEYLSDRYELHQMLSTGNLVSLREQAAAESVNSVALYGAVFYSPEQERLAQLIDQGRGERGLAENGRGAINDEGEAFGYLSYTQEELEKVSKILLSHQINPQKLIGFGPTEQALRSVSGNSPQVLHLSTHGFFIPGDKKSMENRFLARFPTTRFSSMQRSGLAFVGANRTWEGATDKAEEVDGIITANEVALLDMTNTHLAVLSACQTAVGEYSLEGVYGMHRGFKQAGVRSILATLWNVNDKSTSRFMVIFYQKWLSGTPMQKSLNEAVRELRKEYPSPFYWAPFVLMDAEN